MKGVDDMIEELMRHLTAGRASLLREIRAELHRVRRERDAAREALRITEDELTHCRRRLGEGPGPSGEWQ